MNLETLKALYSQMKSYEDKHKLWIGFLIAREERKQR